MKVISICSIYPTAFCDYQMSPNLLFQTTSHISIYKFFILESRQMDLFALLQYHFPVFFLLLKSLHLVSNCSFFPFIASLTLIHSDFTSCSFWTFNNIPVWFVRQLLLYYPLKCVLLPFLLFSVHISESDYPGELEALRFFWG